MKTPKLLLACAAPIALAGCVSTGLGSAAPVTAGSSAPITSAERQQGQEANAELVQQFGGTYSGPSVPYVTRVAQKIAVQSGLSASPSAFTVTVLDSPVENAFATPGGYIYVTRGLLALMNDEAELAGVLGHEVGHVAARHSQSRQAAAQRNSILGALGQVLVGVVAGNSGIGKLLSEGIGTGAQLATLGYSRSQETQADQLGVRYLSTAGYDTDALASMLADLAAQTSLEARVSGQTRSTPAFASTHPEPQARVQSALGDAQRVGGTNNPRDRDAFLNAIDGVMYGDNPRQGVIDGRDFLYPDGRFAFTIPVGFQIQNDASAVSISGPNVQAQFSTASYSGNLDAYVQAVLTKLGGGTTGSVPQGTVRRTTVNGVSAATTTVRASSNSTQVDVTVFAYAPASDRAYHFVILTPAGQGIGAAESMVQSFRTLTATQAAAVKPKFVRVVAVKSGDTANTLSARMAFDDYKLERFLVMNGLSSSSVLRAGDRVKIVTY